MKRFVYYVIFIVMLSGVLELCARIALSLPPVAARMGADTEVFWERSWVRRHRNGVDVYYSFDLYDSTKGWYTEPNLRNFPVFEDKILNTNSHGIRGTTEYLGHKDPHRRRVMVLGDSFTFGDGVSDDETYSSDLQRLLPNTEVINMGVHGYGHDQMLILLEEMGRARQPDIVVLGFIGVDMTRNVVSFRDFAKPRFVVEGGALRLTHSPVPTPARVLRRSRLRPAAYVLWSLARHRLRLRTGRYDREVKVTTTAILDEFVAHVREIGARPVLAYLPTPSEINEDTTLVENERFLFDYCEAHPSATCLSARPTFARKLREGQAFAKVGHWGPPGHRAVAEALRDGLLRMHLVPTDSSAAGGP